MERRHGEGRGKTMDGMSQDRMFGEPSGNPIASSGHPSADMMMKMMKKTLQKYLYSKRFKFFLSRFYNLLRYNKQKSSYRL